MTFQLEPCPSCLASAEALEILELLPYSLFCQMPELLLDSPDPEMPELLPYSALEPATFIRVPTPPMIQWAYSSETGFIRNVPSHELPRELRDRFGFHTEKGGHGSSRVIPAAMPVGNGDLPVVGDAVGTPAANSMDGIDEKTEMSFIDQETELGAEH